ncbi:hypothetical protein [Stappia indica]|uniref:hypothetical protein n=1 Tax=Stappia indica TaxID=538381 RepID=UPI001CD7FC6E|nr:hypothetical protein [Stappia indica]MCA1298037.1 hypothetical protein [Stappia indica]
MSITVSFPAGLRTQVVAPATTNKTTIFAGADRVERYVDTVRATNRTGSAATLVLHFESGISAGAEGVVLPVTSVAANATEVIPVGVSVGRNDALKATLGTAGAIDLIITYAERTQGAS